MNPACAITRKSEETVDSNKLTDTSRHNLSEALLEETAGLVTALRKHGITLACAESCTGGLIAQTITSVPGASEIFWGSIVSYSEKAKTDLLGVSREVLDSFGAVSGETAREMALGVSKKSSALLSISVTGFAGPGGGNAENPVGTVWIGLCCRKVRIGAKDPSDGDKTSAFRFFFEGGRERIRTAAALEAIRIIAVSGLSEFLLTSPIDRLAR